jgi:hypothetical protein
VVAAAAGDTKKSCQSQLLSSKTEVKFVPAA